MPEAADPFNLQRFLRAQEKDFAVALAEILAGKKYEHWVWFIFPQIAGLGYSADSVMFAISSLGEARAYAEHPVLGARLLECFRGMMTHQGKTAVQILGSIDAIKLRSCVTLFRRVLPPGSEAEQVLELFYSGIPDPETERILTSEGAEKER
jgi:uncharacterized protein (DUF1810 family)